MSPHLLITLSVQDRVCRIVNSAVRISQLLSPGPSPKRGVSHLSYYSNCIFTQMPYLPDGSFARGEQWFAKRGRPKNHTEALPGVEGFSWG